MQLISPEKVIRGKNAWAIAKKEIIKISNSPLLLGRSNATEYLRLKLYEDLIEEDLKPISANLKYDCCIEDLDRIYKIAKENNCDSIIAAGGGKVLDSGKLLAEYLSIPVITVPLSSSTCAGWTALANIYSKEGQFVKDVSLKSCPKILVFDHKLIKTAPKRTLASGIADSLAKWYESSLTSSNNNDGLIQQALQIARVIRDQLFIDGEKAFKNPTENIAAWSNVIEGNSLTAGLIGGIGGERCRTAAAHALHNAITQLKPTNMPLHGEIVGVGILLQLKLEEALNNNKLANQTSKQLEIFMKDLELPTTILELGIDIFSNDNLHRIAQFACREESEIHYLPFKIGLSEIKEVISDFEKQKIKT